jgi:riboflavin synthase
MFSGIIKSIGTVVSIAEHGTTLRITVTSTLSPSLHVDQSIAHDGVCLTIVAVEGSTHSVEVVHETLTKTNLANLAVGRFINLEKSITTETLLDGHLVQGHIDTTLMCTDIQDMNGSWKMFFQLPSDFAPLVIPHGSICINGVSLTVAELGADFFAVAIIPYTFFNTNFHALQAGDLVNVEFDLIGKYFLRQMQLRDLTE